jgi:hypothetical protein
MARTPVGVSPEGEHSYMIVVCDDGAVFEYRPADDDSDADEVEYEWAEMDPVPGTAADLTSGPAASRRPKR